MINLLIDTILLAEIEMLNGCPECKEGCLETGAGFGKRDYECDSCDFSIAFPIEIYAAYLAFLAANPC